MGSLHLGAENVGSSASGAVARVQLLRGPRRGGAEASGVSEHGPWAPRVCGGDPSLTDHEDHNLQKLFSLGFAIYIMGVMP